MAASAIKVRNVSKSFDSGRAVLVDVNFEIAPGEMVALIGASGSGKSTLIRSIAGLVPIDKTDRPRHGEPTVGVIEILGLTMQRGGRLGDSAAQIRTRVGIVFQQFNLVPRLSVLTNVLMGALGRLPRWRGTLGLFPRDDKARAMLALGRLALPSRP